MLNPLSAWINFFTVLALLAFVGCSKQADQVTDTDENCMMMADSQSPSKKVCFENHGGYAVIEGDIVLGKIESLRARQIKKGRNSIAYSAGSNHRWPKGLVAQHPEEVVIPYKIDPSAVNQTALIEDAIQRYNALKDQIGVRFQAWDAEEIYLNIALPSPSPSPAPVTPCAQSSIGYFSGHQDNRTLTLYPKLMVPDACPSPTGNIIHELGHVLGLLHEHQREDRDKHIKLSPIYINETGDALLKPSKHFSRQLYFGEDFGAYDLVSIMHYSQYQGAYVDGAGWHPAFTKLDGTRFADSENVGQRAGLSPGDISGLAHLYSDRYIEQPEISNPQNTESGFSFDLQDHADNEDGFIIELATFPIVNEASFTELKRLAPLTGEVATTFTALNPKKTVGLTEVEIATKLNLPTLPSNSTYLIRVLAFTNDGRNSIPSAVLSFTTLGVVIPSPTPSPTPSPSPSPAISPSPSPSVSPSPSPVIISVPSAPAFLTAELLNTSTVRLSWVNTCSLQLGCAFRVLMKKGTGGFTALADTAAGAISMTKPGLTGDTSYTFKVRAVVGSQLSAFSEPITVVTLKAPTLKALVSPYSSRVRITFTDNSGFEAGYVLERSDAADGEYSIVLDNIVREAGAGPEITKFDDLVNPDSTYFYRVRAKGAQAGAFSNYSVILPVSTVAAPTNLTISSPGSLRIQLNWQDNSSSEEHYRVEMKTGTGAFVALTPDLDANATSFLKNTGLKAETSYTFKVRAINGSSLSSNSNIVSVTTLKWPTIKNAYAQNSSQVLIQFQDNSLFEAGYILERSDVPGGAFSIIRDDIAPGENSGQLITVYDLTVNPNSDYSYQIRAKNAAGNAFSRNAVVPLVKTLAAPTLLTVSSPGSNQVKLLWEDNCDGEEHFRIQMKTGSGGYVNLPDLAAGQTSFVKPGLVGDTSYTFRLRAVTGKNHSGFSNSASIVTLRAPTLSAARAMSNSVVRLTFVDNSTNEEGYVLRRRAANETAFSIINDNIPAVEGSGLSKFVSDPSASPNTTYSYQIRAKGAAGSSFSHFSAVKSVKTPF